MHATAFSEQWLTLASNEENYIQKLLTWKFQSHKAPYQIAKTTLLEDFQQQLKLVEHVSKREKRSSSMC